MSTSSGRHSRPSSPEKVHAKASEQFPVFAWLVLRLPYADILLPERKNSGMVLTGKFNFFGK